MPTLTLTVQDIAILTKTKHTLLNRQNLSSKEYYILDNFLSGLPEPETLLDEKFPLNETFEIKLFDIVQMWPQLAKWVALFNNLPKNGNMHYPHASWIDADEDSEVWRTNVIINVAFIPSLAYSKRNENKIIGLRLKTDGSAVFQFWMVEDAENFPELYNFKGSWKEAYLLTVKTLHQGWPQTKFPKEFEALL